MRISYAYYSLKDLSDISNGERLIDILSSHGLDIVKVGEQEPIKNKFIKSDIGKMWNGIGLDGECTTCYFLFKGDKEVKFSGMATWSLDIHPESKAFNGISLWLTIPKKYDFEKLIQLGDDLFKWSGAIYGYITEDSQSPMKLFVGNPYDGIPNLLWVNYLSSSYINEPDFHLPDNHLPVGHGVRVRLSEMPDDERLANSNYLEGIKNEIGLEWFWAKPRKCKKRVPYFNRSAITKT